MTISVHLGFQSFAALRDCSIKFCSVGVYVDGDGKRTRKPMVIKRTTPESNVVAGLFMAESNDEVMEEILESRIAFVGCMFDTTHYGIMVENRSFKSSIMKAIFFDVPRPVLVKK